MPEDADASADKGLDPTVLQSHVSLSNEFKDQEFGAAKDAATLNLAYAFGKTARPDWLCNWICRWCTTTPATSPE